METSVINILILLVCGTIFATAWIAVTLLGRDD